MCKAVMERDWQVDADVAVRLAFPNRAAWGECLPLTSWLLTGLHEHFTQDLHGGTSSPGRHEEGEAEDHVEKQDREATPDDAARRRRSYAAGTFLRIESAPDSRQRDE